MGSLKRRVGGLEKRRSPGYLGGRAKKKDGESEKRDWLAPAQRRYREAVLIDDVCAGKKWSGRLEEMAGVTEELEKRALGPDVVEQISKEEQGGRFVEYLADLFFSEKGYRVHKLARAMIKHPYSPDCR